MLTSRSLRASLAGLALLPLGSASAQVFIRRGGPGGGGDVSADNSYKPHVMHPAYSTTHPRVLLDEAHAETNTRTGAYAPFADLLTADGYVVASNLAFFSDDVLADAAVLVISGARGGEDPMSMGNPAFRPDEVEAVARWVEQGGSLLLVGAASPFFSAQERLTKRLGVDMPGGRTMDSSAADPSAGPGALLFSDDNKLLGDHPIIRGRDASEQVHRVVAFSGQSLKAPEGATALLRLSDRAQDVPPQSAAEMQKQMDEAMAKAQAQGGGRVQIMMKPPATQSAAGRVVGAAFTVGKGRVVILGDATMLSAEVSTNPMSGETRKLGMQVPGNDDQQFALNVVHWLTHLY